MRTNSMSLVRMRICIQEMVITCFSYKRQLFRSWLGERKRCNLHRGRISYLGFILGLRLGSRMTYKEMEARECKDMKTALADSVEQ